MNKGGAISGCGKNGDGNFKLLYKRGFVGYNKSAKKSLHLLAPAAFANDFCRG